MRIAFTVDEEVGRGVEYFDVEGFGAEVAYTLDGSGIGELEIETFSARQVKVLIRGRGAHPGTAKGKLVNAVKLAADFVASLPPDSLSPETTEDREGFVHPTRVAASAEEASVTLIVRDHDDALLEQHTELVRGLAAAVEEREPRARVRVEVQQTYLNMRTFIEAAAARRDRRRGGNPPGGPRAGAGFDPRRHGRSPPLGARPADTQHLHRRPELSLAARMGERAGHGGSRCDGGRARAGVGRARRRPAGDAGDPGDRLKPVAAAAHLPLASRLLRHGVAGLRALCFTASGRSR